MSSAPAPKGEPSARTRLLARARWGGITLVVGAGVSLLRCVPGWQSLAKLLWVDAFGNRPSPWETSDPKHSPHQVPQFLPIIFELAYREMGETAFLQALQKNLYSKVRYPSDDARFKRSNESLAVIARLISQEYKRASERRIDAAITFNVDDLIEQAVDAVAGPKKPPTGRREQKIVRIVGRSTHPHVGRQHRPIPVYHIHGFVPSDHAKRYLRHFDHMLVFTDAQYWSSSAMAISFANRIIASALGESHCVFVGLSMTDINLLRWLALRTIEKDRDLSEVMRASHSVRTQQEFIRLGFRRHFWIRPPSDDPTGLISEFLNLRGVESVEIDGWEGDSFQALMEECFPAKQ